MEDDTDGWRSSSARKLVSTIERLARMLEDAHEGRALKGNEDAWSTLEDEMHEGVSRVSDLIGKAKSAATSSKEGEAGCSDETMREQFLCAAILPNHDRIESHGLAEAMNNLRGELTLALEILAIRIHYMREGQILVQFRGDDSLSLGKQVAYSWPCLRVSLSSTLKDIERTMDARLASMCPTLMRCDMLCSSPTALPILSDTISDITKEPDERDALATFRRTGLLCVLRAIPRHEQGQLLDFVHEKIRWAEAMIRENHSDIDLGISTFAFREIASRGCHRYDLLFDIEGDDCLLAMRRFAHDAEWMPLVRQILNLRSVNNCEREADVVRDYEVDVSVVYSRPGAGYQDWHADGPHLGGQNHYGVCVFVPLVNLNHAVGFTQFWLGSHTTDQLLGFGGAATAIGM